MINFVPTLEEDQPQILKWIEADPFHAEDASKEMAAEMITGVADCILSCALKDEMGVVLYLQLIKENALVRIGTQFGPEEEVSKSRVASAISQAMPALKILSEERGAIGMVFYSMSPHLIKFMSSFGFIPRAGSENVDEYIWKFDKE